jgi:predicted NBD/HSP70 family sugar kinase
MADQTLARYVNELSILTMLRTEGPASRAQIARRLSLTPGTITRVVSELVRRELVWEIPSPIQVAAVREPGRPAISLALNPAGAYFLGVEMGVGVMRYALLDLAATVVATNEIAVSRSITPKKAVRAIAEQVARYQDDRRFAGKIQAAGVTVPGLVTSEGYIVHLPILGWKNVNLLAMLRDATQLPFIVENNANAAAFGSVYTQPNLPSLCTIFLKLGTGCGGAAIINGRLLRGAAGTATEFGHMRVTEHGHRCSCGQVGCLESWVNLEAMARIFRGTTDLTRAELAALPSKIATAVASADGGAVAAVASLTRYLSLGIVTLTNIFNPTTFMLGGVMRPLLECCLEAVKARVVEGIVPGMKMPEIRLSHLGVIECAVGAATIAHHHAFDISTVELQDHELRA